MMCFALIAASARGQGVGGAGTLQGTVKDPLGHVLQALEVRIDNPRTGFMRTTMTGVMGRYVFRNLPPSRYHLTVEVQGFETFERDVDVRTSVPITLQVTLALAGTIPGAGVLGQTESLLERDSSMHTDVDQRLISKLPLESPSELNQVIRRVSPGVVSDANGFFHPTGDYSQAQFVIDGQAVTDQQSRLDSNQIPQDAVQSMQIITGVPPAEFGDKTSLVVPIITKSGFNQPEPIGAVSFGFGSFRIPILGIQVGGASHTVGNFLSLSGLRTDRFLDPPEFQGAHHPGARILFFDRLDVLAGQTATLHLNVHAARSAFDLPNRVNPRALGLGVHTFNFAPGYAQATGAKTMFSANAFVRQDFSIYPFEDQLSAVSQDRKLTTFGIKTDIAYATSNHNVKVGGALSATRLDENLTIGFTDPSFNSPCLDSSGNPSENIALKRVSQCEGALAANPNFNPDLLAFDLTRQGSPFAYRQAATIKQQATYVQDDIGVGNATFKVGLRFDHYQGLTTATLLQPRAGVSYLVPASNTVLRASYGRTLETPYNENLLLSSGVGAQALTGTSSPPLPGRRNQVEVGIEQQIGRWIVADVGHFNKHTTNAYDVTALFATAILLPVAWRGSQIDGFTGRINLVEHGGFSALVVMAHTNAIYFPPATGGALVKPPCDAPGCSFRIDADQKFNTTTNLQYILNKQTGAWVAFSWRYDSGLLSTAIRNVDDLLRLTPAEQAVAGVSCGGIPATASAGFSSCTLASVSASRLVVPAVGARDLLDHPARVAPRQLFDLGLGTDNLWHGDKARVRLRFSVSNLTNKQALYNFLSTSGGTHVVAPRAYQSELRVSF